MRSAVQVVFFTSSPSPSNCVPKVRGQVQVQVLGLEVKLNSNPIQVQVLGLELVT